MLFVPASLVKDAENTTLSLIVVLLQVRVKTMSNAACVDHERYSSSIITDNMICAAAPSKGVCQVSIYMDYYDLNVVTCSKDSLWPAKFF